MALQQSQQFGQQLGQRRDATMDDSLREVLKERVLLEGQKAYIVINAAGAAALLAFLQAIWSSAGAMPLKRGVLYGIATFAAGVGIATFGYVAHHWALRRNQIRSGLIFQMAHVWIPFIAIACFVAGLLLPVKGGFDTLNPPQVTSPGQAKGALPEPAKKR